MIRIIIISLLFNISTKAQQTIYTGANNSVAGKPLVATYQVNEEKNSTYKLIISSAFGLFILTNESEECTLEFQLPAHLIAIKGDLNLKLLNKNQVIHETAITIRANTSIQPLIEAFCGPKQILSGGQDYTAVIGTVLDSMDNPWPANTPTVFQYRFKNTKRFRTISSNPLYAYHRFFSNNQSGHPVISVSANGSAQEEFELTINPGPPERFALDIQRDHDYADGKQIAIISTTKITDQYGNTIADGSLVDFTIYSDNAKISKAHSPTINGIATLHIPAPKRPEVWNIQASINQFVDSKPLLITFKPAIQSFTIHRKHDAIRIGPIKSFIDQWVPYGTPVEIEIFMENTKVTSVVLFTESGTAVLDLPKLILDQCRYSLKANCGGQEETYEFEL